MASTAQAAVTRAHAAAVERVATYITDHPEAPHSLQDLADLAAMNKRAFSHVFLTVMGMGVKAFVRSVRVDRAKFLLDETELSIAQVMRHSGFASTDAGRRAFLLTEQVAPMRYRGRLREQADG